MKPILLLMVLSFSVLAQEGDGKISGYMFGDYFYNIERDTALGSISNRALTGDKDLNGLVFRRIYFTYDYEISNTFSTRFRIEADNSTTASNGKISLFIKDAYLKWKNIFPNHDLIAGIQPTPAFEVSESYWGYRALEKTILDLRGIVSSRDFAVSLKGKFDQKGNYGYWAMFGNNSGVNLETDKYKRYYLHLYLSPLKNLSATLYGDLRTQSSMSNPFKQGESLSRNIYTSAFFLGYSEKEIFSVGAETIYSIRQNTKRGASAFSDNNSLGLSLFGSVYINKSAALLARYDYFDPDNDAASNSDAINYFIFGLNYLPDDKVMIIPNVQIETFQNESYKSSVTARLTFFWTFL